MSAERNYPVVESLDPETNGARLEEIGISFEKGIDRVSNGLEESAVLFEGDFILKNKKNHNRQIDIGKGLGVDYSLIFMRFMRGIKNMGRIVSTDYEKTREFLKGETPISLYFGPQHPNVKFPVDKTTYLVATNSGSNLVIYSERFYWANTQRTPLMERWVVENNQSADLSHSPTNERVPVLA